jgi:tRNA G18 (ribose-2'-O)-methylase SpoU
MRGYFGIGIWHAKTENNVGTLWRSAYLLGASFVFTVGRRYRKQASDTATTWRHIPLFHFEDVDALIRHMPYSCPLVGVELDPRAHPVTRFIHPERACYLLGAEDHGLSPDVRNRCHALVQLPGEFSMNVAAAGTIVLYDRLAKVEAKAGERCAA